MKSFKERLAGLRDFARQGGKSREKQQAGDGNSSSSSYQAGGHEGGYLEPTLDAELIAKGMKVSREPLHSALASDAHESSTLCERACDWHMLMAVFVTISFLVEKSKRVVDVLTTTVVV